MKESLHVYKVQRMRSTKRVATADHHVEKGNPVVDVKQDAPPILLALTEEHVLVLCVEGTRGKDWEQQPDSHDEHHGTCDPAKSRTTRHHYT